MTRPRPKHVALLMDGNRRWAQARGVSRATGHRRGAAKALEAIDWCGSLGIEELTLCALSLENLERNNDELDDLGAVAEQTAGAFLAGRSRTQTRIAVRSIGNLDRLPKRLRRAADALASVVDDEPQLRVNVTWGYSGRDELLEAFRRTLLDLAATGLSVEQVASQLTDREIASHLYTAESLEPDFVIRTGGEIRTSGFMPWQTAYSEYYFCASPWPAFTYSEFLAALLAYQRRHRTFGR